MLKCLVLSLWIVLHPVHVTLTSIDYVPESDSLKVFVKLYFDDFLLDLRLSGVSEKADDFSSDNPGSSAVLEDYLNRKLVLKVNNEQHSGKLIKSEIADNEIKLNLNYKLKRVPSEISVRNLIMVELYKDMSNLVIVRVKDFEEGIKLTSEITEKTFNMK